MGLSAKEISLVLKISAAKDADDTRSRAREPTRRYRRGPYLDDRYGKHLVTTGLRRWRWPMSGSAGGLGGRRSVGLVWFLMKRFRRRTRLEITPKKKMK